ncbi:MAG: class I tRNA ligase family protein [Candidatus Moranbacteria bacterium]|nr:class I tRNA ligase family protein [Candidatus Moranbacteria bacterium]
MAGQYSAKTIEKKWQDRWAKQGDFQASDQSGKEKCYVLDMFPYPSGDGLHVGHVENYTATDIYSRFKRLQGFEVLHPIGWDAFGLPAENFAIKTGVHPDQKTHENIANFTRQIKSLGISYDWSREIDTSSPEYYKWTQWLFLFLYKNGLAYRKQASVNWCPSCQTVLANEQVVDGVCERCKTEVVQKDLKQWFFKITDFIEDQQFEGRDVSGLISGLKKIDWPESTKKAQQHWIGRSEGAMVRFHISQQPARIATRNVAGGSTINSQQKTEDKQGQEDIEVFTTRVDTIFGCTYVVVAPEHPLVSQQLTNNSQQGISNKAEVEKYLEATKKKTELERTELAKDKTGVKLEGIEAINPFTGEAVPVFVADYVLGNYGTGAVMAVPAHDERDFAFAKKYDLPIRISIEPVTGTVRENEEFRRSIVAVVEDAKTGKFLSINWGEKLGGNLFIGGGLEEEEDVIQAAVREIEEETGYKHVKLVAVSEKIHHHYFAASKNVYRNIEATGLHFRLADKEKAEQRLEADEHNKFTVEWITREDAFAKVADPLHRYLFDKFIQGKIFAEDGVLADSGAFSGLASQAAREKITQWLEEKKLGEKKVNYRLRDWLVSRQRYWGAPIPIIYCDTCGEQPVPEQDLPVSLPMDVDFRPTGESPLTRSESFHDVLCPKCGEKARRESDTMDTFVCSSWYYLRFVDPKNTEAFADPEKLAKWLPVDVYMGGAEHTVLHLLYARFFAKALRKYGLIDFDEPFMKLRHQGMVLAEDGRKMSKSLGNVVNPDDVVGQFGADSLRLYEMFMGPLEDAKAWKTDNLVGPRRFLEKVWRMGEKVSQQSAINRKQGTENNALRTLLHKTIQKVTQDIEEFRFNTAVSSLMILVNEMDRQAKISQDDFETFLLLLSPFAPHIAEELWERLGHAGSITEGVWPKFDPKLLQDETVDIVVQVNGKLRAKIAVASGAQQKDVETLALQDEKVALHIQGKTIRKVIFVPNRLMNIVV